MSRVSRPTIIPESYPRSSYSTAETSFCRFTSVVLVVAGEGWRGAEGIVWVVRVLGFRGRDEV